MPSLLHDITSKNISDGITLIIPHVNIGRSAEIDELLLRLELKEHCFVAAAAHSIFYSDPKHGILGEWNNMYFEELWDYALPSSFYEHGTGFEKIVLSNERQIHSYACWLLLQYQNLLFSAMCEFSSFYNHVARNGGYVFLGTNFSLIVFGNHKNEYFDRFCDGLVFPLPIKPVDSTKVTIPHGDSIIPYYIKG